MAERDENGGKAEYGSAYHVPVLSTTVTEGIITESGGVYVDATLGGGGHAAALLDALSSRGRVIGIDQDVEAIETVRSRLAADIERGRFKAIRGNFEHLERLLAEAGETQIDGLVLDLGVSSHQLDTASRGFSYLAEGELDMRMDTQSGLSAHEILNDWDRRDLRSLLSTYGEEPRASQLARAIESARPLRGTRELAQLIRQNVPARDEVKTLSRVFQAIRIAVNREIEVLEAVLEGAVRVVRPGGRIAVISYHSLEDRRVKRYLRYGNFRGEPMRDVYGNLLSPWDEVTRKPVRPDEAEIGANPRSRSARLRIAERTGQQWPPAQAAFKGR